MSEEIKRSRGDSGAADWNCWFWKLEESGLIAVLYSDWKEEDQRFEH